MRSPNNPTLSFRVTPGAMEALDALVEKANARARSDSERTSRAALAGEIFAAAMRSNDVDVHAVGANERAASKAARDVRARLLQAVRETLEEMANE